MYYENSNDAGTYVKIQGPNGNVQTVYMHLDNVSVKQDQTVSEGQEIGTLGRSGSGLKEKPKVKAHLHFEIRLKGADGFSAIDPMSGGNQPIDAQVVIDSGATLSDAVTTLGSHAKQLSGAIGFQEKKIARRKEKRKDTAGVERRQARNKSALKQTNKLIETISNLLK